MVKQDLSNNPCEFNRFRVQYRNSKLLTTCKVLAMDPSQMLSRAEDAEQFLKQINFNYDQLQQTYSWDFCRKKFKSLYPEETFY